MFLVSKTKFKKGFSLIEILVVFFIVSVSLMGVLSLLIQNIQVQSINKNNLIASSLAQEGIELIRQVRDNNWKSNLAYDTNLSEASYWTDFQTNIPVSSNTPDDFRLYLKNGFYVHWHVGDSGLEPTIFSRKIFIRHLDTDEGAPLQVRSLVSWTVRNHPYNYELQTLLYDWR